MHCYHKEGDNPRWRRLTIINFNFITSTSNQYQYQYQYQYRISNFTYSLKAVGQLQTDCHGGPGVSARQSDTSWWVGPLVPIILHISQYVSWSRIYTEQARITDISTLWQGRTLSASRLQSSPVLGVGWGVLITLFRAGLCFVIEIAFAYESL